MTASHPNVPNTQKVEVSKHSHESDQIRSVGSSLDKTRGPKYSASVPKQESECLWCSGHDSLHELWVTLIASMSSLMASRLPPLLAVADQVANGQFEYPRESAASEVSRLIIWTRLGYDYNRFARFELRIDPLYLYDARSYSYCVIQAHATFDFGFRFEFARKDMILYAVHSSRFFDEVTV